MLILVHINLFKAQKKEWFSNTYEELCVQEQLQETADFIYTYVHDKYIVSWNAVRQALRHKV